jgi:hypothetical protein
MVVAASAFNSDPPNYVLHLWRCTVKLDGKVRTCWFGSEKWFWFCTFSQFAEVGERYNKAIHLLEKSVMNMIWQLFPVFDWLIIIIGPGSLLLVLSPICNFSFCFMGGVAKKQITKLGCKKSFAESRTEHHWSCLTTLCKGKNWLQIYSN